MAEQKHCNRCQKTCTAFRKQRNKTASVTRVQIAKPNSSAILHLSSKIFMKPSLKHQQLDIKKHEPMGDISHSNYLKKKKKLLLCNKLIHSFQLLRIKRKYVFVMITIHKIIGYARYGHTGVTLSNIFGMVLSRSRRSSCELSSVRFVRGSAGMLHQLVLCPVPAAVCSNTDKSEF